MKTNDWVSWDCLRLPLQASLNVLPETQPLVFLNLTIETRQVLDLPIEQQRMGNSFLQF